MENQARTLTVPINTCLRCGYSWPSRYPDRVPLVCPKCRSSYWNRPRKRILVKVVPIETEVEAGASHDTDPTKSTRNQGSPST